MKKLNNLVRTCMAEKFNNKVAKAHLIIITFYSIVLKYLEAENAPSAQYSREYFESDVSPPSRVVVGSDPSSESTVNKQELTRRLKALVNPFNPSQITIKLTSNRRRWTHVFPLGNFLLFSNFFQGNKAYYYPTFTCFKRPKEYIVNHWKPLSCVRKNPMRKNVNIFTLMY